MLPQTDTGYAPGSSATGGSSESSQATPAKYWPLSKCRRAYTEYQFSKREELDEQKDSRRYYHGSQWTAEQLKALKRRRQPAMTFNRIQRKIDGVVGLIERLKQDPKAFPRTPQHEKGAELATAALRYVLDSNNWGAIAPEIARDGAIDGIGGLEIVLKQGDRGDMDVGFEIVEPDSFFYDPRSFRPDFSDARYMGVSKWVDVDLAKSMFPDKAAEIDASVEKDTDLTSDSDRERRWFISDGVNKFIRLTDIWYQHSGGWCYTIFTGQAILMEDQSFLRDQFGHDECKYLMFSGNVDQDGDRYGFVRNMKSAQDGINAKQSKMQHILASRRLIMTQSAVQDIETARKEWARPDGVVIVNPGGEVKADDQTFDFTGWAKLLELNLSEIENFGPNPALIGQGIENKSGRAISLLQQAGIAELGPYILAYKGWKLRVYRAIWLAVQQHWQGERWIRVTDDDQIAQFIQINGIGVDPATGFPTLVNAIGQIDVDIIIDEGPDYVNMQADAYDTLSALAGKGSQIPPDVLIELSPLTYSVKKKIMEKLRQAAQQPNPEIALKQAELQIKQQDAQQSAQVKAASAAQDAHIKAAAAEQDAQLDRDKAQAEFALKREEALFDMQIEREKADNQMLIASRRASHDAQMRERTAEARQGS